MTLDAFVLNDEFNTTLEYWKKKYAEIMGNEGLTDEERAKLLKNLGDAISETRDSLAQQSKDILELMGLDEKADQTATMNMAEAATYDQFETYLGIAMGQQMSLEQGNDVRRQILSALESMNELTSPDGDVVREINSRMRTANEYLLDIRNSNREILSVIITRLSSIEGQLTRL